MSTTSATLVELSWSCHRVLLDPMVGTGLLIRPLPSEDVVDPFAAGGREIDGGLALDHPTVHDSELYDVVLPHLDRMGYEPRADGGDPSYAPDWDIDGLTHDGRQVVCLFGREPVVSSPAPEQIEVSFVALRALTR